MHKDPDSPNFFIVRAFRHWAVKVSVVVAFGGLLFYCAYGVPFEFSMTGAFSWLAHIVAKFAKWCIGILVTLLLLRDAQAWLGTIRSLGRPSFRLCRRIYELTERAKFKSDAGGRAMVVSGLAILFVMLVVWAITRLDILLWLAVFQLTFMLHEPLDNGRPPAVLLLGASQREVFRLQAEIEMAVRDNRVVSLLNLPAMPMPEDLAHEIHEWDVFRVPDQAQWERMVRALESITPIVVLDSRIQSEHVTRELQFMLDPQRIHKLIVVVADGDQRPSADKFLRLPSKRVCGQEQALTLLHEMTRSRYSLPKPDNILNPLLKR
jgi:hypothetical protein